MSTTLEIPAMSHRRAAVTLSSARLLLRVWLLTTSSLLVSFGHPGACYFATAFAVHHKAFSASLSPPKIPLFLASSWKTRQRSCRFPSRPRRITTIIRPAAISDEEPSSDSSFSSLHHKKNITGVTLKIAVDANGGVAELDTDKSERFTSPESLDMVHRLRRDSDAVLVGWKTVLVDNPSLTVRRGITIPDSEQPLRVVIDPSLSLLQGNLNTPSIDYSQYAVFRDGLPTVVFHSVKDIEGSLLDIDEDFTTCIYIPRDNSHSFLKNVLKSLDENFNVKHIMVEGGPATARSFLQQRLVDRAIIVKAPICFRKPLHSSIDSLVLNKAGLQLLESLQNRGGDEIQYWSKHDIPWPTMHRVSDWP